MSGTTQCTQPGRTASSNNDSVVRRSHMYLNLPTAAERAVMQRQIDERKAKEGDKELVLDEPEDLIDNFFRERKQDKARKSLRQKMNFGALGVGVTLWRLVR